MKNLVSKTFLPAAGISILAALPCVAQTAIVPVPLAPATQTERRQVHQIRLNYVRPSVMAWWLDPKNSIQPAGATPKPLIQELPAGIDRIVAIDPQNALLVFGTDEGVRELRDMIQFLDRPQNRILSNAPKNQTITVEARFVTIKTEHLSGIWTTLSEHVGRGTPAAAFLKSDEELELGGQVARREAQFGRTQRLTVESGAAQLLDFGPPQLASPNPSPMRSRDFSSLMPVIPPPETGDDMEAMGRTARALTPFNRLQLQLQPTLQPDGSVSLELRDFKRGEVLGRAASARFELRAGESLALALPDSKTGSQDYLLFSTLDIRLNSASRIPLLGDLPLIGELFRSRKAPQKTP